MGFLRAQLNPLLESILGLALFTLLAVTAAVATRQTPYQTSAPLLFIVLAALVAFFIGKRAAYLGLIAAAIVFAVVLFKPVGSWHVDDQGARVSLAWMLMGGLAAAWIFARQENQGPHTDPPSGDESEER
jgi:K+-sensing histidine kinase KdpD